MTRRYVLLAVLAAAAGLSAAQPAGPPDLILVNGRVVTLDGAFRIAEAVAIRGERFAAVGTEAEIRALAGPATKVVDMRGGTAIPGLMDNHLHGAGGGPGIDLSRARSMGEVAAAVRARAKTEPAGTLITSNSDWHEAQLAEQRLPLRDDLDLWAPDHPVVLVRGGHEYILNSAALRRWQIDEQTPVPDGGRITRYPDGRLNGELVDAAKSYVKMPPPPERSLDERIAARVAEYKTLHAAGLTTVRHPGVSPDEYRMLQEMQRRGLLTMRVNVLLRPGRGADAGAELDATGIRMGEGDHWLRVGGVKLGVDGGFEGGLMRAPYAAPWDEGGRFHGLRTMEVAAFERLVQNLNTRGWRLATHAVGDAAIDMVLDAYEKAHRQKPITGQRWAIEHAFIGRPDHFPRIRALGLALSVQDHLYLAGPSLVKYWGPERAALTTPVRSYLDAGIPVSAGTDAPVVPYPPLWAFYHFVTRDTITGGVLDRKEAISPREALEIATKGNAYLMFEEDEKGTIEPGRLADLVVLPVDPLTADPAQVRDAEVRLTLVGGTIVHQRP